MWDDLLILLIPESKLGFALWGVALFVLLLIAAALVLGWAILT
jgi:hypothetical protein